jgi:RDD family
MKSLFRLLLFCVALLVAAEIANASVNNFGLPQASVIASKEFVGGTLSYLHAMRVLRHVIQNRNIVQPKIADEDSAEDEEPSPVKIKHHHSKNDTTVKIGSAYKLGKSETSNNDVVMIGGSGEIDGTVNGDLVMVGSKGHLAGIVNGDVVMIGSSIDVREGATSNGDFVSIGSSLKNAERIKVNGERTELGAFSPAGPILSDWISNIFLLRPMSPFSMFGWSLAIVVLALRLAVGLSFPKPFVETDEILHRRLAPSFLVGLGVIIGCAILCALLTITVVGVLAIPFVILGAIILGFLGRISVSYSIGKLLLPQLAQHRHSGLAWMTAGTVVTWILFCIPVIGMLAYGIVALLSFGAFSIYLAEKYKIGAPKPLLIGQVTPSTQSTSGETPPLLASSTSRSVTALVDKATFQQRLGSNLIDLIVLYALLISVHQADKLVPIWVIYRFAMYAWRSATLGEIALNLHVEKSTGLSLTGDYSAALIRALSSLVSLLPVGLGFFWILFDPAAESWHDKISGSYVRKKRTVEIQHPESGI